MHAEPNSGKGWRHPRRRTGLDKTTFWPIRSAQPAGLLGLLLLASACFFCYKLLLLLVGAILYKTVMQSINVLQK